MRRTKLALALTSILTTSIWGCSAQDSGSTDGSQNSNTDGEELVEGESASGNDATDGTGRNTSATTVTAVTGTGGMAMTSAGGTASMGSGATNAAVAMGGSTSITVGVSTPGAVPSTAAPATGGAEGIRIPGTGGVVEDPNPEPIVEVPSANPFVVTGYDPLSTFAADVDTASYDTFRQHMSSGVLPPAEGVRVEEFVNYFAYDYPAPSYEDEVPFTISLAAAPTIMQRETTLLRIGIQGASPPPEEKKPANLVFLVDISGSMASANKLPLVQYTLTQTLDILEPTDTVSIVTYGSTAQIALPPTAVAEQNVIVPVIDSLAASGSTAGADGLGLAYQQAETEYIDGGINHVILCTDGDFNVGPYTTDEIVELVRDKRDTGVTLTALGFGINNDPMMEAVSNAGNGMYAVITDQDQATTYVVNRMLSTLVHIAKDMKIQVEFNPDYVYAYRLIGYENRALADTEFRDDEVDAAEIGAGHRVSALYELVPVGSEIPELEGAPVAETGETYSGEVEVDEAAMVLVKVRYKEVNATDTDPAYEVTQILLPDAVAENHTALDGDFQWAIGVASFAELLKLSPYASTSMLETIDQIVQRPMHESDPDRLEFVSLFEAARPLLETESGSL